MGDSAEGWDLFSDDEDAALPLPQEGSANAPGPAASVVSCVGAGTGSLASQDAGAEVNTLRLGVPAVEHPYFTEGGADAGAGDGSITEMCEALRDLVPTACELLSTAGTEGKQLAASLGSASAIFLSLGRREQVTKPAAAAAAGRAAVGVCAESRTYGTCAAAARQCAAEAWRQIGRGSTSEAVVQAHALAHCLVALCILSDAESCAAVPALCSTTPEATAMRHADQALLLCPELPIPVLHSVAARCDRAAHEATCRAGGSLDAGDAPWIIGAELPPCAKAPAIRFPIRRDSCTMSVAHFRTEHLLPARPTVIDGHQSVAGWAAAGKWADLRFWALRHGHRSVPVELGVREDDADSNALASSAEAEGSMLFAEFVRRFLLPSNTACWPASESRQQECHDADRAPLEPIDEWTATPVAYLAQHLLLAQIPALRADISVPQYCALGRLRTLNVWVGTVGTVTALHYDEDDNFLAQVAGFKYVRLYPHSESERLYASAAPRGDATHGASFSPVRAENPDLQEFPRFAEASYEEVILTPGDMLFIPKRTWHYVRSLSTSISVNFWF